jgi:hypothetical protein
MIHEHVQQAKNALYKVSVIEDYSWFEQILLPLDYAAKKATTEREDVLKFLEAY